MTVTSVRRVVTQPPQAELEPALQARMVSALARMLETGAAPAQLIETHISFVLVTPRRAYKIKKAVDLGFLDFTTLGARRFYCEEEVRLNARLAAALYRGVVRITGTIDAPSVNGSGPLLDYAVEMSAFPQEALLSHVLARQALTPAHVDRLAQVMARFHEAVPRAGIGSPYGGGEEILGHAEDNFTAMRPLVATHEDGNRLAVLEEWTRCEHHGLKAAFEERRDRGFVRECHGDLHLGNVLLLDHEIVPFDCIEFNEDLRWIDVMSEIAFTVMDLDAHGEPRLAMRLLNAYLELTGDYAGLRMLPFYLAYRAMVRAKIAAIRAAQVADIERDGCVRQCSQYLRLALGYSARHRGAVIITRGFSGTGKTTFSQPLLEHLRAVRIRSDIERKRMHGIAPAARTNAAIDAGIYAGASTVATYRTLADAAAHVIEAGYPVVVDATFLKCWQRAMFHDLAARRGAAFLILTFEAPVDVLERRIDIRRHAGSDASEATREVLAYQMAASEPLTRREAPHAVAFDATTPLERAEARDCWRPVIDAIAEQCRGVCPAPGAVADVTLEAKLTFLRRPESYPDARSVDVVETHLSYVFLTDRDAFKLKKPVRTAFTELSSLEARGHNCSEELFLNRRLASEVYVDVVALTDEGAGTLALQGAGAVVDWLVGMRRLPANRMLDRLIASHELDVSHLAPVVRSLCAMYARADQAGWSGSEYEQRLIHAIEQNSQELGKFAERLPPRLVEELLPAQLAALRRHRSSLRERAKGVVEGHGDLRPEHVCLVAPPQIIDCLDFSRELRMLDPVDELGFLALECERLGAPEVEPALLAEYVRETADQVDVSVLHLYQSHRAAVRARLAIAHLRDHDVTDAPRWQAQARAYLELALRYARSVP